MGFCLECRSRFLEPYGGGQLISLVFGKVQRIKNLTFPMHSNQQDITVLVVSPCNVERYSGIIDSFATDGTFGPLDVIMTEQIVNVAGRVVDCQREVFVERPGAHSYF